ncbi:aminotransferase class V-fold PLP-dependent enzyme [Martelella mediterranea]|uniref:aminotransferase class V-fold PLP-dependent enzyme n=1 Tax=Martelella mediterranea TaxID=293089 RepID=UPI001E4F908F|nr:aminotransferase class V-fold PLP-dependent enzyme [Martelella mediterranea]MCD1634323.1 aminotransferase class V-fold PLP-dependent enzyme [Martelella mediterranea]
MLECQKHLFSIPDHISYLDAAYISPIPRIAEEAGKKGAGVKAAPWDMTIGNFYDEVEAARALAASFIGARADDIAVIPATSYGIAVAAANVAVPEGSAIIMMENEHTSHRYAWYELARARGAKVVAVSRRDGEEWGAALVAAIRHSDIPVAVVAGTILHWFEGMTVDIDAVADAARAVGAALVMDGTQWVGAVPFDVARIQPDFLSFATYKFLLGPYRLGFLYASEKWQQAGRPIEFHSWNRAGGERPDFYLETMPGYLPGARRFDMGERSDFAVLPVALKSMELLKSLGGAAVHARLVHLNRLIWAEAEAMGLGGPDPAMRVGHIAVIELGEHYRDGLAGMLKEKGVHVTVRGTKMRVSPHIYNDEDDIRKLFTALKTVTA